MSFFRRLRERVGSGRKEEETATCKLLQKVPIFQQLSGRELHKIAEMLYGPRDWLAGEEIVKQGCPGMGMYIVASGQVRIVQQGDDGFEKQLATKTRGDFVGAEALIDESPRLTSAYALQPCSLLFFCRPDFLEFIDNSKLPLALEIVEGLAQATSTDLAEVIEKLKLSGQLRDSERLLKGARRAGSIQ